MNDQAASEIVDGVLAGDRKAAARAISLVENDEPSAAAILDGLYLSTGRAFRVGITGPPGAGKSTLTAALAGHLRAQDRTVGILAVDPTSPFSGGALLGDRIRMSKVATDPGVFIRSMASRGSLGGIARTTGEAADILDAMGKEYVFIETVGVGQSEVEVADAADTTVVVLSPESGDGVQTMKAGLMEVADVFVVNKADRAGADKMARAIEAMLDLAPRQEGSAATGDQPWRPPVLRTVAVTGTGVEELVAAVAAHRAVLDARGLLDHMRRERVRQKIRLLVDEKLWSLFWRGEAFDSELDRWTEDVLAAHTTPYAAAAEMFRAFRRRIAS